MDIQGHYKHIISIVASVILFVGYLPYIINIFKGITRPHAFSWLIWGALDGIVFTGQLAAGGGAGAYVTGCASLVCIFIFLLSLKFGEKKITRGDWLCLLAVTSAIPVWAATSDPLGAIIIATMIDIVGFIPTFRKTYSSPWGETALAYLLSVVKSILSLIALDQYSMVTVLYPVTLAIGNLVFLLMLYRRRKIIPRPPALS